MAIVLAFNMVYLLTLATVTMMLKNGLDVVPFLVMSAFLTCQVFQLILVGGLFGKSALAGIGSASLLCAGTLLAFIPPVSTMNYDEYRIFLLMPLLICILAAPALLARFAWGWQLIDAPKETIPFRRFSLEDIFSLMTVVASIGVLVVNSARDRSTNPASIIDPLFLFVLIIIAVASVPMLGIVHLHFRAGLGPLSTFLLLLGLYLPHHLFVCLLGGFTEPRYLLGAPLCALGSLVVLQVYKTAGYHLVRFDIRLQRDDEELSEAEKLYIANSRRSARVATVLLLLFTCAAVTIFSALDSRLEQDMLEQRAN